MTKILFVRVKLFYRMRLEHWDRNWQLPFPLSALQEVTFSLWFKGNHPVRIFKPCEVFNPRNRVNTPLWSYKCMLCLPSGAITLTWDPCKKKNHSKYKLEAKMLTRLTEVVGHQRRRGDRRLGELLSPAALLLQVLQESGPMTISKLKPLVLF